MGFRGLFYVIGNSVRISYYTKSSAIYRIAKRYDETKPHNVHSRGKKKSNIHRCLDTKHVREYNHKPVNK